MIILEDYIDKGMINNIISKNIIITFKKYFGLNFLKNNYQYIATLDCEIDFIISFLGKNKIIWVENVIRNFEPNTHNNTECKNNYSLFITYK